MAALFRNRNFALYSAGQSFSLLGTWMQQAAVGWLVYRVTRSTVSLGLLGVCARAPAMVLSSWAGVLADRHNRRRILYVTQILSMSQAIFLGWGVWRASLGATGVLAMTFVLGILTAIDIPVRQAFLADMMDRQDFGNAIALNSTLVNVTRLAGPALAGILVASQGEAFCFLLNGFSFLAAIATLFLMHLKPREQRLAPATHSQLWMEGIRFSLTSTPICATLAILSLVGLAVGPYSVLMPAIAQAFHGGPRLYGFMLSAPALGALAGGLLLAARRQNTKIEREIASAAGGLGLLLVGFSWIRDPGLAGFVIGAGGFVAVIVVIGCQTLLQNIVSDDMRGRIMSLFTVAFIGSMTLGGLLAGFSAARLGINPTVRWVGLACLGGALRYARTAERRSP